MMAELPLKFHRFIIGPFVLLNRSNGQQYLKFMEDLFHLMEDILHQLRYDRVIMHDGAPPHYSLNLTEYLD